MLLNVICRDLYLLIYVVMMFIILCGILGFKHKDNYSKSTLLLCICLLFNSLIIVSDFYSLLRYIATYILMILFISNFMKEKKCFKIISFIMLILFITESIILDIIQLFINYNINSEKESNVLYVVASFISLLLTIIIYINVKRKQMNIYAVFKHFTYKIYFVFILGLLAFNFLLTFLNYNNLSRNNSLQNILILFALCFITVLFIIIGFYMLFNLYKNDCYKDMIKFNEKHLKEQSEYYHTILEKEHETKKFRHDINNHLISLKHLYNKQRFKELGDYINSLDIVVNNLHAGIHTGNEIVNAVVNHIVMKEKEIKLHWTGNLPIQLNISQMDLCTMFSNIIKNAVEAVLLIKDIEDRIIRVKISYISCALKIDIKNKYNNEIKINQDKLETNKEDKANHGFGLENVGMCIVKYNGELTYNITEDEFQLIIILYNV